MSVTERKRKIRHELLRKLKAHKEEDRLKKSSAIAKKLFFLKEFIQAKTVLFYLSFDGEVDTVRMIKDAIRQGKKVALPVLRKENAEMFASLVDDIDKEVVSGPYGTRHPKEEYIRPVSPEAIDLVVVPGVAFDEAGNRLGRGKGYYDRFLSRLPDHVPTVGLAFDFQIIKEFPPLEPHDLSVTTVLSA